MSTPMKEPGLKTAATTLPYFSEPRFNAVVEHLWPAWHSAEVARFGYAVRALVAILRAAPRHEVLLIDSIPKISLAACALIGLMPARARPRLILHGSVWKRDPGIAGRIQEKVVQAAHRGITDYVFIASEECTEFFRTWHLTPKPARALPLFPTFGPEHLTLPAPGRGYVFAGGNAHRDYDLLVEAARHLPEIRFRLATRLLDGRDDLPPNLAAGRLSQDDYIAAMRGADVIVVPMTRRLRRSAGQQTYLNAMALGKPVVVTRNWGVADHIRHGVDGMIVDHDPQAIVRALAWILDPDNADAVTAMSRAAVVAATETMTFANHVGALTDLVVEALREAGPSGPIASSVSGDQSRLEPAERPTATGGADNALQTLEDRAIPPEPMGPSVRQSR
jgi:glycosyltransferase involved in cell wall biosynthesis